METDGNKIKNNEKIEKILKKLLDPNFKIQNDVYLRQFLTHFAEKDDEKAAQYQNKVQLKIKCCQWIIEASTLWKKQTENLQPAVLAFALNLASQLSAYEQVFVKCNCRNVYESLTEVVQSYLSKDPSVTLGWITLLYSFLEHKTGLQWIMSTTHWTDIINLGLNSDSLDIRKKAYYFVQKLLESTISFNRNFSVNLVTMLVKPLRNGLRRIPSNKNQHSQIDNEGLYRSLKPSLDFIIGVTEPLLRNFSKSVLQLFVEQETPLIVDKYHRISSNEDFSFELLQIQFILLFHSLCGKLDGVKTIPYDASALFDCYCMLDLMEREMDKDHVRCMMKICNYAHDVFCSLASRMPIFTKNDYTIEYEMQVIYLQLTPIFAFSLRMMPWEKLVHIFDNFDAFRKRYLHKLFKTTVVKCIEISLKWDAKLKEKPDLIDDVVFCFQYIGKMKKLLNKERAAIIFSALVYSFCDALTTIKEGPFLEVSSSTQQYFHTLMETMVGMLESFDLTWKDSIETISVMDYAYDFLKLPFWTNENMIVQTGLKLLKTTISKYMSPDMVLLIDNKEDSKISETGNLVYAKCQDSCGEIRDSALEVVYTLSLNANTKFPAFTNILLNAELPQLIVKMAFNDGEYYVRASAFKCLQELIQIQEVWTKMLEEENNFLDNLLGVFGNESEGIVRKEAASLIHKIAKYQSFPEEILSRLYDVMTHATIGDLHEEVKYTALDFWFNRWDEHLIQQGMIDRAFPSHTFSKELKKIVALTPNEVKKRIIKVLNQLAHIGCLYVIKCAVKDECAFEVTKKATEFTFSIFRMFKVYKIPIDNVDVSQPPSPVVQPYTTAPIISARPQTEPITLVSKDNSSDPNTISDYENFGSPQYPIIPFFNPDNPFSLISYSLSLDEINLLSSEMFQTALQSAELNQNDFSLQNQSPYANADYQQPAENCLPVQNQARYGNSSYLPWSTENTKRNSPIYGASPIENTQYTLLTSYNFSQASPSLSRRSSTTLSAVGDTSDIDDTVGFVDANLEGAQLENVVTNNTNQMKTSTYLAPSQFMKFVYDELETYVTQKAQCVDKLDEFDSLLDDILTKCTIEDTNSMK